MTSPTGINSSDDSRPAEQFAALEPADAHNLELQSHVHPPDWRNPTPSGRYNLVVIGAGTAGLVTAAGAAGLGAKVALIERSLMGGDCLNVGCVPSKALIRCARAAGDVRRAAEFGVRLTGEVSVDFPAIMERMRKLRAGIAPHDSAARFQSLGIDVYLGQASFIRNGVVAVAGQELEYARAVIATGGRAAELPIPGLEKAGYLTNETVFSLTELPRRLIVIGGGPIGCELAQVFARFGSQVTLLEMGSQVLGREDADAAEIVAQSLQRDGVDVRTGAQTLRVESGASELQVFVEVGGRESKFACDKILVAAGRAPNVDGLNLDAVGVEFDDRRGVEVDDRLRTTNSHIYAAGDICSQFKFTHAADAMARIVIKNALFFGRSKASNLIIPWCTYTDPEVAHVGKYPHELEQSGIAFDTTRVDFGQVDRAILEGETSGFLKVHHPPGKGRILGATLVASHAGDMIGELSLAMTNKIGLGSIANVIYPYPTQAEAIKKAGDAYNRTRLTPFVKKLFTKFLAWRR